MTQQQPPLNQDALDFYRTFRNEYIINKLINEVNNSVMERAERPFYDSRVTLGVTNKGQLTETPWYYHYSKPQ